MKEISKKFPDSCSAEKVSGVQGHSVRVTTGTAGKVFSGAPADWKPFPKPLPINTDESRRSLCPCCSREPRDRDAESGRAIAQIIDHTLLRADATREDIRKLCSEAKKFCFYSVCVSPMYVSWAWQILKGSGVKICTVVAFPLGAATPRVKAFEAEDALRNGADEIDMVMNIGALKSDNFQMVLEDMRAVRRAASGEVLKVILETSLLTQDEKIDACRLAEESGADFIKTSSGFSSGGATVQDVQLMRRVVGVKMGVKASGGIKEIEFAKKLIRAGANRIGTSSAAAWF